MARFYFHSDGNGRFTHDRAGVELPDLAAAQNWAETDLYAMVMAERTKDRQLITVTIADRGGAALLQISSRDVLTSRANQPRCPAYAC